MAIFSGDYWALSGNLEPPLKDCLALSEGQGIHVISTRFARNASVVPAGTRYILMACNTQHSRAGLIAVAPVQGLRGIGRSFNRTGLRE